MIPGLKQSQDLLKTTTTTTTTHLLYLKVSTVKVTKFTL